jgi:hypothetical protein
VTQVEAGFARLSHNIPVDPVDLDYAGAMRELVDKVVNSDNLGCYLTLSETGAASSLLACGASTFHWEVQRWF